MMTCESMLSKRPVSRILVALYSEASSGIFEQLQASKTKFVFFLIRKTGGGKSCFGSF